MPEREVAWAQDERHESALVMEALRVFQGGREQGLRGGDRQTDGAGPLRTGRQTGLNNSEVLKRVARREVTASGVFRKISKTLRRRLNPLHSIVLL